jgi:hypothetical protein
MLFDNIEYFGLREKLVDVMPEIENKTSVTGYKANFSVEVSSETIFTQTLRKKEYLRVRCRITSVKLDTKVNGKKKIVLDDLDKITYFLTLNKKKDVYFDPNNSKIAPDGYCLRLSFTLYKITSKSKRKKSKRR